MDRRVTIALVAVLAVLGGYIWWTFFREGDTTIASPTAEPTRVSLTSFDFQGVTAIEVRDVANSKTVRAVRQGESWRLEQPSQGEADKERVGSLILQLARINVERTLTETGDRAQYGLDPVQYQVELEMQDGSRIVVQFGSQNPDGSYYYASKPGDANVYLVRESAGDAIKEMIEEPPFPPTPTVLPSPTATPVP